MAYNDPTLQEIKDRLNIADVIGGYLQLKKAGKDFKALCPFHGEKTASLYVSPSKQIWHCFGCGEGGDVFGFVMKQENLEFREALKLLAERAGVKLPEYRPPDPKLQSEQELFLRINNFAARFYHQILMKDQRGKSALEYLEKRGLTSKTMETWQIGFAPEDFHMLENALKSKNIAQADMVKAGVCAQNERGQIYDRFRNRITFPILNYLGEVVGFSARILNDDGKSALLRPSSAEATEGKQGYGGQAKYVNSPETIIYNKSKVLFGLNFAKNEIRKKDEAIIVEGQMDCISLHQAGFSNAVASSGTALTIDQLQQLSRLTKNLKFCFDSDQAGLAASRRAGELALKQGFRLKVIILRAAKDPDELVKHSPGLWEKAVSEAVWFLDFYMDLAKKEAPWDQVEQLHFLSQHVVPLISHITDSLEQDHYIKRLMVDFGVSERVIREQIRAPQARAWVTAEPTKTLGLGLEKELLGAIILYPEIMELAKIQASLEDFTSFDIRELLEPLYQSSPQNFDQSSSLAKEAAFMVESQLDELAGNKDALIRQLRKDFALFKITALKRQQYLLQQQITETEKQGNKSKLSELNQIFADLTAKRLEYEKQL